MAHKQILFRSAAREKVLRGTTQLADAVRVTLGPRSKSVLIEKKWGVPIVCNDGVTIAKEFDLKDPEENLGARMLRQAAEKTGDMVGDGTSTATILAHAIFADGVRNVVAGASAIDIKRGLDRAAKRVIEALRASSWGSASTSPRTSRSRSMWASGRMRRIAFQGARDPTPPTCPRTAFRPTASPTPSSTSTSRTCSGPRWIAS